MKKPDSLRAALVAALPDLATDPDKFLVFVKSGMLAARQGPTTAFEYRYTLTIGMLEFPGDPNAVFVAVVAWARDNQADLLTPAQDQGGITFSVDIIDPASADLSIELKLTETVRVIDGVPTYGEEPTDAFFGLVAAAGADVVPPPPLHTVSSYGSQLVP